MPQRCHTNEDPVTGYIWEGTTLIFKPWHDRKLCRLIALIALAPLVTACPSEKSIVPSGSAQLAPPQLEQVETKPSGFSPADMQRHLRCSVAKIFVKRQPPGTQYRKIQTFSGTAFFINGTGDVLTAAHVIDQIPPLPEGILETRFIIFSDGSSTPLPTTAESYVHLDPRIDAMLIHLGIESPCFLPLGSSKNVTEEEELSTAGYPGSSNDYYVDSVGNSHQRAYIQTGHLMDRGQYREEDFFRASFFGDFGMSGSPVVDSSGNVIGVISSKEHLGNSFVYVSPIEILPGLAIRY
jgi:S1-C subfamily serine protease